jgi:hypothetical protein
VSPLGAAGEFYFENVGPGRHAALVTYAQGRCAFTLEVPLVEAPQIDLGTLRCTDSAAP